MAIMPLAMTVAPAGGADPFTTNTAVKGVLTHGHLPENDHHGGAPGTLPDATKLPDGPRSPTVDIAGFAYAQGDLTSSGPLGRPPVVSPGQPLTFVNEDAAQNVFHTITACRAPCTATTGIAFPLANGPAVFDSGELGFGPAGFTPAANRREWQTPTTLTDGTYTYFCRIHPFMRGAFRVKG
jgi:plastocyanin